MGYYTKVVRRFLHEMGRYSMFADETVNKFLLVFQSAITGLLVFLSGIEGQTFVGLLRRRCIPPPIHLRLQESIHPNASGNSTTESASFPTLA